MIITTEYLRTHRYTHIFVFGDNFTRKGCGGAAIHRYEPNSYGFITKRYPSYVNEAYYTIEDYKPIFTIEMKKLIKLIKVSPKKTFLISKIGSNLANRYYIYENVIQPVLIRLAKQYNNILLL